MSVSNRPMVPTVSTLLLLLLACPPAALRAARPAPDSTESTEYRIEVPRLDEPPEIDGLLGESEWAGGVLLDGFVQMDPEEGAPAPRWPRWATTRRTSTSGSAPTTRTRMPWWRTSSGATAT